MTISALPTPPLRSDPTNFAVRADAFLAALPTFQTEANALAAAMNLNATTDTSATSNVIGLGAKTFTVTAGKSFQPGMFLVLADTAAPSTNSMVGQVTSYATTSLVVNVVLIKGSGTKTAWVISQSVPYATTIDGIPIGATTPSTGAFTTLSASGAATVGVGNTAARVLIKSSVASGGVGSSDLWFGNTTLDYKGYLSYDHALNTLSIGTSGVTQATLDASGNLGLGVTPSAWTSWKAMQIGPFGSFAAHSAVNAVTMSSNLYDNAGGKYIGTGLAAQYQQSAGAHYWYTAPSGTAGNPITFTQAMTLSAAGQLQVPAMYANTVTTPRNVFVDASGNIGGISSVRASKTNIANLSNANWLTALSPVSFNYRKRDESGEYTDEFEDEIQYGLIAEDVELIKPEFCIYVDGKLAGVHYDRMISPLIKIIQDLEARLAALEAT